MRVFRARLSVIAALIAAGLVLSLHAQTIKQQRLEVVNVGLPAVDLGLRLDDIRGPGAADLSRRQAILASIPPADVPGAAARSRTTRVLVKFIEGLPTAARLSAVADVSRRAVMTAAPDYADFDIVQVGATEDAEAVAQAFSERSDVEYAQVAYTFHKLFVPNDPLYATNQWNLPMLNLERAWDIQPQAGSAITVAVLDSGMAYQNATFVPTLPAFRDENGRVYPALGRVTIPYSAAPQLVGAAGAGRLVAPHDFIWDDNEPFDFDGHGTHVSGTIGQLTNDSIGTAGVAFGVRLMPVKVIDSVWDFLFRAPNEGTDDTVARGIRYAADNNAKIINMSIGRTGPPAPAVESAIRYAVSKGVFIAIAAGNEFEDGNPTEVLSEIAARVPGVVSVAAVDRARAHAFYSSTGSWVELSAPGGSGRGFGAAGGVFQQTFNSNSTDTFLLPPAQFRAPRFDILEYVPYQGTSMASPHVAGIAAMLMQQGITDPAAIEEALEKTAVDLGTPGRDDTFGFGLVDARAALRGLGVAK
jgi:serine protease